MVTSEQNIEFTECVCGNGVYKVFRDFGTRKVIECSNCGLYRSYPLPLRSVCDDNYQTVNDVQSLHVHQLSVLKKVIKLAKNIDAKILDVGCSSGNMLKYLIEKGYSRACGIEMNDYAVKICEDKKLNVRKMNVEDMDIKDKYDIVFMNHVLEHVENLNGFITQLKQILSKGAFVIIAVPNIGGRGAEKPDWIGFQFEQHYWHFTPNSLTKIFLQNNFSLYGVDTLSGGRIESTFYKLFKLEGDSLISVFKYD